MLDLSIYKYNLIAGNEDPEMPGLFTGVPPRRAARGREQDRLVLNLSFENSATLPPELQREFLEKLTVLFYNTPGTVTFALKAIVSQLNDRLLARNLRAREGATAIGIFQALVLHGETVIIAQSGPAHAYILGQNSVEHYYEADDTGPGLGASRVAAVRFYRADLHPGDRVLLCAYPPAYWSTASLEGSARVGVGDLRNLLTSQASKELRFLLLQAARGKGELLVLSLHTVETPVSRPLASEATGSTAAPVVGTPNSSQTQTSADVFLSGEPLAPDESQVSTTIADSGDKVVGLFAGLLASRKKPDSLTEPEPPIPAANAAPQTATSEQEDVADFETFTAGAGSQSVEPTVEPWSPDRGEPDFSLYPEAATADSQDVAAGHKSARRPLRTRTALAKGLRGWRALKQKVGAVFSVILARIVPGQADKLPSIPQGVLIFIAVAVPLIIVAVATTVYIQNGRGEQHEVFMAQAREAVAQAQAQTDPVLQRVNYAAALDWIKKAEEYGITDESKSFKSQIASAIDAMDGISRFDLHPALSSDFDRGVRITQIWSSQTEDIYLLDGANGRVLRMVYTRPGYELDPQFTCGPGMVGSLIVGPLVDFVLAPSGNPFDAVAMGVDASGNLLYCSLNTGKTTATTLPPPDAGWGKIQAVAYQSNVLSILDTGGNAVWRFEGFGLDFSNKPRLFFDNIVPNLSGAIDLAVYLDDLFVLNQDGHMILCTYSNVEVTPTRCTDPYPYRVGTAGQTPQEMVSLDAQFTQIQATQPPEPSLYFLDASGRAVYQFSMSLNFVRRLQPITNGDNPLPDSAPTALTVTAGRNLVMAYDNRVFIAAMPTP